MITNNSENLIKNPTVLERMGGYPEDLLDGREDLSDRDIRKKIIAEPMQQKQENN